MSEVLTHVRSCSKHGVTMTHSSQRKLQGQDGRREHARQSQMVPRTNSRVYVSSVRRRQPGRIPRHLLGARGRWVSPSPPAHCVAPSVCPSA